MKTGKNFLTIVACMSMMTACSSSDDIEPYDGPVIEIPTLEKIQFTTEERVMNESLNDFNFKFLNKAASDRESMKENDGNIAVSPLSASMSLAMLANSGDTPTENAICSMFGVTNINTLNSVFNQLMRFLHSDRKALFRLANSAWYNHTLLPSQDWVETMEGILYATVSPLDFSDSESVKIINSWSAAHTNGLIKKINEKLDPASVLKLINALYYSAEWISYFDEEKTYKSKFHGKGGDTKIDMMRGVFSNKYHFENSVCDMLELTFKGNSSMYLILPKQGEDANEFAANLTFEEFCSMRESSRKRKIKIELPKFKINTRGDITGLLQELGLPSETTFEKMGVKEKRGLVISQFTYTEIDENGAKVAAVTDISDLCALPYRYPEYVTLIFDRPFIYVIMNKVTDTPLIAGVVNNIK